MFSDAPFFLEHIKAGKLVPLAVGTERSPSLPDVPTTGELGAYWADKDIIDGQWKPPVVNRMQ